MIFYYTSKYAHALQQEIKKLSNIYGDDDRNSTYSLRSNLHVIVTSKYITFTMYI
jgi:hypothetical protein